MTFAFEFRSYRTPFKRPLRTAHGEWAEREGVIIKLTDDAGRSALGEIAPIPRFGTETLEQALELCRSSGPTVDAARIAGISDALPCCQFAFGSALGSLGVETEARTNQTAAVACLLPAGVAALTRVEHALAEGFTRLKWKVGVAGAAGELFVFRDLLRKLPEGVLLRLDANGAWDRTTAETWISACEGESVEFIEQPLAPGEDDALMDLAAAHPGLIALDESVTPPGALRQWLDRGWPGVIVVKPSLGGEPKRLRRLLVDSGADVVFSTALETAVGWHAALRFSLGHPNLKRSLGFGAGKLFSDDSLNPPAASSILQSAPVTQTSSDIWTQPAH